MRRSGWPPNSLAEWVVGQNFKNTPRRSSSGQTQILKVSLSEDEASGDEKLEITYPGRRRTSRTTKQPSLESMSPRKVQFDRGSKPLKSALKKTGSPIYQSSDTLVEESSEDPATTDDESSDTDGSDTFENEAWVRKNLKQQAARKAKTAAICKKHTDTGDISVTEDDLPHLTCQCSKCVKGRRVLGAMIKLEARQEAAKEQLKNEYKDKGKDEVRNETKSKRRGKGRTKKDEATSTEASETSQTEDTEDDKKEASPNQSKKKGSPKENDNKSTPKGKRKASPKGAENPKAVNKDAFKLPKFPKSMEPNLIMPVRTKVLQCEHTIEGPNDPRPNAFVDTGKGIVRVYHGPTWGNHAGELYGNVNPAKLPSPLPPSARPYPGLHGYPPGHPGLYGPPPYGPYPPYPPFPPYPHAGPSPRSHPAAPPRGTPTANNIPSGSQNWPSAMHTQMPDDAARKEAASKGMGLTGQAWPETPAMIREERALAEQEKAKSEAVNNFGGSQKDPQLDGIAGWKSGSNQGWENSGNNAWGEQPPPNAIKTPPADGHQAGGGSTSGDAWGKPSGDGVAQQFDFSRWGSNKGSFTRASNKNSNDSQKGAWFGKHDSKPAISHHASDPSTVRPADGSLGNGGGGNGWGNQGANQGSGNGNWNSTNDTGENNKNWETGFNNGQGWNQDSQGHDNTNWNVANKTDNSNNNWTTGSNNGHVGWEKSSAKDGGGWYGQGGGSNRNSPQEGPDGNAWGPSSGSKPQSRRSPKHDGGWENSGWNDNNNARPCSMPGGWEGHEKSRSRNTSGGSKQSRPDWNQHNTYKNSWGGGHSRRVSPNERSVGTSDWPEGQGPHMGNGNKGWNNDSCHNARRNTSPGGWDGGNGGWSGHPAPSGQHSPYQTGGGSGGWDGANHQQDNGNDWDSQGKKKKSPTVHWMAGSAGGYSRSYDNLPSNAGPTYSSWANPDLAQDTGGKVDNW